MRIGKAIFAARTISVTRFWKAAPMAGGMTSSSLMELLLYPVLYLIWRQREILTVAVTSAESRVIPAVVALLAKPRCAFNGSYRLPN